MKDLFFAAVFFSIISVLAVNPLDFPEYRQKITVTYRNQEQSRNAKISISPLPEGKKLAYTARWDDTNHKNLQMGKLLAKHGMKGTFMLHGSTFKSQGKALLAHGHAIGNHTEQHPWLPMVTPNRLFYEIALHQVRLETELQTCVVSFVFPFGSGSSLYKDFSGTCLKVFDCSNLYVFPFYWRNPNQYFRRSADSMLTTSLFASNDRNPTYELYKKRLQGAVEKASPSFLRVTHGIHVWMSPQGFKELDRAFAETAADKRFVFLTDNEYGAYRYSALHAGIRKVAASDREVSFEITRFLPGHLGSEIPLSLTVTPAPLGVSVNGIALKQDKNGLWLLPHSPEKQLPEFFEWLKDDADTSVKLPGLKFSFNTDENMKRFRIKLTNRSGKALKNICLQLSLPPKWQEYKQTVHTDILADGASREWSFDGSKVSDDPDFSEGVYHFIARLDFDGGRIYRTFSRKGSEAGEGLQRHLRYLGPIPRTALSDDVVKKLSLPGVLEPLHAQGKVYNWKKYRSDRYNRYSFNLRSAVYRDKSLICPAVAEFTMPADGEVRIAMYKGTEFYCNGNFVGKTRRHYKIKAKKGKNRLYLPNAAVYESIVIFPPGKFTAIEEK